MRSDKPKPPRTDGWSHWSIADAPHDEAPPLEPPLPSIFRTQELELAALHPLPVEAPAGHAPMTVIAAHSRKLAWRVETLWNTDRFPAMVRRLAEASADPALALPTEVLRALADLASRHGAGDRPMRASEVFLRHPTLRGRGLLG